MTKYSLTTLGFALMWGVAFLAQAPATAKAGEAGCCGAAGCAAGGNCGGNACCDYCPRCGCKLVPVCHPTCETKKTTVHKFCCNCKEICVPGVTRVCGACENCNDSGNGGQDCCDCRCRVHEVHKLMVCPATKEHCVRGCTVEWVCPNGCGCQSVSAPGAAPAAPGPAAPAPAPSTNRLPPPPRTTDVAPLPQDVQSAATGY